MVGNVETYKDVSAWETVGNDKLAQKIIESDEFTTKEKLDLVRALDKKAAQMPMVIWQTGSGWNTGRSDQIDYRERYKLTC